MVDVHPMVDPKWPISGAFGESRGDSLHHGVDRACPEMTPGYALLDGCISRIGPEIDRPGGGWGGLRVEYTSAVGGKLYRIASRHIHPSSTTMVKPGDQVKRGQHIFNSGKTGWNLDRNGKQVDVHPHVHTDMMNLEDGTWVKFIEGSMEKKEET